MPPSFQRAQHERHSSNPQSLAAFHALSLSPQSNPDRPSSTRSQRSITTPSSSSTSTGTGNHSKKDLPPIFWYMEAGDWEKAASRARRHPRDVKSWATLKTKESAWGGNTRRLALHHACFKLRSAGSTPPPKLLPTDSQWTETDPFVHICSFILQVLQLYPPAAGERESRHGCLPLHLVCFASCASRKSEAVSASALSSTTSMNNHSPKSSASSLERPPSISRRSTSDNTTLTNMSCGAEDETGRVATETLEIHSRREAKAVQVINALLDAYPKAIRVDSEGGRLPLHTACAGRATPRVISTLLTAYPAAARHRNKDGFLPLHLAAHWGVSHPTVAMALLKSYPDATVGRNRWERTPLEEALCMAGENGRSHQSSLVRALRKHPSFWTTRCDELLEMPTQRSRAAVDVDESLPSTEEDDDEMVRTRRWLDEEGLGQEVTLARYVNGGEPRREDLALPVEILIQNRNWNAVAQKIRIDPLDAERELKVMTRGGFKANTGFFGLHYACERNPPLEVCQALIEAHPVAVLTRCMPGGCLPLHIACTWLCDAPVIESLLMADHGGVAVKDELGNLPLHSACFSGATTAIVEALIRTDPKAVRARNHQGSRPIDICKRLRHPNRSAVLQVISTAQDTLVLHGRNKSSSSWTAVSKESSLFDGNPSTLTSEDDDVNGYNFIQGSPIHHKRKEQKEQDLLWI